MRSSKKEIRSVNGEHMQIGEVAARTGLSLRTIRHYEEAELVIPSARSQGGFRLYTESDVARLAVISRMKPLGFTLEQMRELLEATDRLAGPPSRYRREAGGTASVCRGLPADGRRASPRPQHATAASTGIRRNPPADRPQRPDNHSGLSRAGL